MVTAEIIAAISTLLCVILTLKRNVYSWPIGLIGVGVYAYVFLNAGLYGNVALQFVFLAQGIYGWMMWDRIKDQHNQIVEVERLTFNELWIGIGFFATGIQVMTAILSEKTEMIVALGDSFVTIASILATYWTAKRKIAAWNLWIVINVIAMVLFAYKGLNISSVLYLILFVLACNARMEWSKYLKEVPEKPKIKPVAPTKKKFKRYVTNHPRKYR